jgi:hypothetical protein
MAVKTHHELRIDAPEAKRRFVDDEILEGSKKGFGEVKADVDAENSAVVKAKIKPKPVMAEMELARGN